ncbi:uncharacterized protein LOC135115603 [Scylla paramamosain]|uniref:uncharacterized protein LOC135115603 n=1 Tax=Scylla paramamosain TaxID=85552 RepID=UPI0030839196
MTDWSKEGLGFVILQQHCRCSAVDAPFCCKTGWRLALCGSRHLTAAEAGYAPVEGEALAVAWCLRKARLFLLGCPNLMLVTDHRPLVKLLGDRALTDIVNPRLFRLKERTLQYRFTVRYLPGKRNYAADFLSRYPTLKASPDGHDEEQVEELAGAMAAATIAALTFNECLTLDEEVVLRASQQDPAYQLLVAKVLAGDWHPHRAQEIECLRHFYSVRDRLSVSRGLVTYTYDQGHVRLVIPDGLRRQVAANLHASHQGLDSMLRRARQTQTVVDVFQLDGCSYLAYADRLTGWLEVAQLPSGATSSKIMNQLRLYFARWGAPEQVSTDGGTNLVSEEMTGFFKRWGVTVRLSSAHYPQSNGRAEAAVKSAKRMLRGNIGTNGSLNSDKVSLALLQYLNTPLRDIDKSPAQLATGRQLRDGVPAISLNYRIDEHWGRTLRERERQMARQHSKMKDHANGCSRSNIAPGSRVLVQNQANKTWDRAGIVVEARGNRQYLVKLDGSGRLSLRTRLHLKPLAQPNPAPPPKPQEPPPEPSPNRPRRRVARPGWLDDYVE